jgi:hypothetical protein
MKRGILLILSIVILFSCSDNQLYIVKDGKSDYMIVISERADSLTIKAANELQKYIKASTGASLPVTSVANREYAGKKILVGIKPEENVKVLPDETWHVTKAKLIFIGGSDGKGTLYSVYSFLENYAGIRFLAPEVEIVPRKKDLSIRKHIDYRYTPEITTRTVHSKLYYDHPAFADKQKVTKEAFPGYVPGAGVHTFHKFISEEDYYKKHPEYFALRNGKRVPTQLCLTNPDVYKIVKREVAKLLKEYPDADIISVSQNDNTQYCTCDKCRAIDEKEGSPAGSMIWFVNKIAREFPDKQISTLAYQYTRKAPLHIKPEKNVLITLCSIECDRSAPIADKCTDFASDLIEWGKITDNIRIWDYTTQFTNFLAPFPNLFTLQPNIQLFRDNNAKWVFEQHSNNPSELFELRSYLTAKLLWEPDVNADSIIDEFLKNYYEEAGVYIRKYIDKIHEEIKNDKKFFLFLYGDPSQAFNSFLSPELLKQYDAWYDEAEKSVAGKPEIQKRVRTARISVDYAILEASRAHISKEYSLTRTVDGKVQINPDVLKRLRRFETSCEDADITQMNEMKYTVNDYLTLYKNTVERAEQPDIAYHKPVKLLTKPKKYAGEDPQTLTDGAFGGANFYANWLGFESNNLDAVIDLEKVSTVSEVSTAFLQVVNHLVFFPLDVSVYSSVDGKNFTMLKRVKNKRPLTKNSKINDIQDFTARFPKVKARYIRVKARNMKTPPVWHHGTGQPSWIFVDEIQVK